MGKRKRRHVPEDLLRANGDKVKTLQQTLLSIIPPPPSSSEDCSCNGLTCFGCKGESFLLRPGDEHDYRELLARVYCVVARDATLPDDIHFDNHMTQLDIIRIALRSLKENTGQSTNVLYNCYDMNNHLSRNWEYLHSSAWHLLLSRIGDPMMMFLLKHTSILLSLSRQHHHQVSGRSLLETFQCSKQDFMEVSPGSEDNIDLPVAVDLSTDNSAYLLGRKPTKRLRLYSWQRRKKYKKVSDFEDVPVRSQSSCSCSHESCFVPMKDCFLNNCVKLEHATSIACEQTAQLSNFKMKSECSCWFIWQALSKMNLDTQIKRQSIFYNSVSSCSALPRDHILYTLKPNTFGANALMEHIFGQLDGLCTSATSFAQSTEDSGMSRQPHCLFRSLLRSMKLLIRNCHRCQSLKLLSKHCCFLASGWYFEEIKGTKPDRNKVKLSCSETASYLHSSGHILPEKSLCKGKPAGVFYKDGSIAKNPQCGTSRSFCRHDQVVSYIWAVSRSILPADLLGDSSTWRTLRKNISNLVRLRKFESFSLRQCVHGLKNSTFAFLPGEVHQCRCFCSFNGKGKHFSEMKSLKPHVHQNKLKRKLFKHWMHWYFSDIVVPIISANFYVTEREAGRQDTFYYPKPIWTKLVDEGIVLLRERNYKMMDSMHFETTVCRRSFGFSKVRFLPKEKGLRILANLKAKSRVWLPVKEISSPKCFSAVKSARHHPRKFSSTKKRLLEFDSVNFSLRDLAAILKRIKIEHPEYLGSSVFDYNDVYCILQPFVSQLRNGSGKMSQIYIVVSDVSKAFDSIDQDRLLSIINDMLNQEVCNFGRYSQVIRSRKSIIPLYKPVVDKYRNRSSIKFANSGQLCPSTGVHVDLDLIRNKMKEELCNLLYEHIKGNVVKIGSTFYLQQIGISQGSTLSSLLSSFYYGHMEKNVIVPYLKEVQKLCYSFDEYIGPRDRCGCAVESLLWQSTTGSDGCNRFSGLCCSHKNINCASCGNIRSFIDIADKLSGSDGNVISSCPEYVLLRLVDDFLFISTSEKLAKDFYNRLRRGFGEYNCYMNANKFGLNFDLGNQQKHLSNIIYSGSDGLSFLPWSGLLINCQTLEIQADYTRYWPVHMSSTLTVTVCGDVDKYLEEKLCSYMRHKCHPLLYDSNINSPAVVRLNAYQAFLICAMKFHCYILTLSRTKWNPKNYVKIILASFRYTYKLIKRRMYNTRRYSNIHPLLKLKKSEIIWLGLSAYIRVLMKKQSRHMELLSSLRSILDSFGKKYCSSCHLKYAVDDIHSSLVWNIKY